MVSPGNGRTASKAPAQPGDVPRALAMLPSGLFLMSSAFEGKRAGVVVHSVQMCGENPPAVCVAMRKGHWIEPLIRDSRCFAINLLEAGDRLLLKKFGEVGRPREAGDPFDCLAVDKLVTGAPIVRRCVAALDCEVTRHIDIEVELAIYVGLVLGAKVASDSPASGRES